MPSPYQLRRSAGLLLISAGILLNPWTVQLHGDPDVNFKLVIAPEVLLIALGAWTLFYNEAARALKRHWRFCLGLFAFTAISFELLLRFFFPMQALTYSQVRSMERYVVNGVPSIDSGIFTWSDYFAYALRPNLDVHVTDKMYGLALQIVTDDQGFRVHSDRLRANPIMVLGDSVTFGWGVNGEESFPAQLESACSLGYDVRNYGVGGWGPAEYYLTWQRYERVINPALIIVGLFPPNDLANVANSRWAGKETGSLPSAPLSRSDLFVDSAQHIRSNNYIYSIPILRNSAMVVFLDQKILKPLWSIWRRSDAPAELTVRIVEKIITESNSKVMVLLLPAQYSFPNEYLPHEIRQRLESRIEDIHLLNLYPVLREIYEDAYVDGSHFTPEGNRIVATTICDYIEEYGLIE